MAIAGILVSILSPHARAQDTPDKPKPEETHYSIKWSASEPYEFEDDFGFPQILGDKVEDSIELAAEFGALRGAYTYLRTPDGDGEQISLKVSGNGCLLEADIKCFASVAFRETPNQSLRTYKAGLERKTEYFGFKQNWTLNASHSADDTQSDSLVAAEITVPINEHLPKGVTLKLKGGVAHNFEERQTEPTWGVSFDFELWKNVTLNAGYESRALKLGTTDFEVKRKFVGSLTTKF